MQIFIVNTKYYACGAVGDFDIEKIIYVGLNKSAAFNEMIRAFEHGLITTANLETWEDSRRIAGEFWFHNEFMHIY